MGEKNYVLLNPAANKTAIQLKKIYHFLKDTFFYRKCIYIILEEKQTVLKKLEAIFTKEYGNFLG